MSTADDGSPGIGDFRVLMSKVPDSLWDPDYGTLRIEVSVLMSKITSSLRDPVDGTPGIGVFRVLMSKITSSLWDPVDATPGIEIFGADVKALQMA
jgi:hypothetical protein